MDMIISINNNEKVLIFPIVPIPKISTPMDNQSFDTINGEINLIGKKGLKTITLSSFFPNTEYEFIAPGSEADADIYVEFFEEIMDREIPARLIWYGEDGPKFNLPVTLESFDYDEDKAGDVVYTAQFKEYKFV